MKKIIALIVAVVIAFSSFAPVSAKKKCIGPDCRNRKVLKYVNPNGPYGYNKFIHAVPRGDGMFMVSEGSGAEWDPINNTWHGGRKIDQVITRIKGKTYIIHRMEEVHNEDIDAWWEISPYGGHFYVCWVAMTYYQPQFLSTFKVWAALSDQFYP